MGAVVIIPTHLDSKRLPRKALLDIKGKTLIHRCYESVTASGFEPYVATADKEIIDEVTSFGGQVIKTGYWPRNGTERVAEAATKLGLPDNYVVVNCQSDMFGWQNPDFLIRPIEALELTSSPPRVTTVYKPNYSEIELHCVNSVKVLAQNGRIDFSREIRDGWNVLGIHFGVYVAFKWMFDEYAKTWQTKREMDEQLEQVRWVFDIAPFPIVGCPLKIDTLEDYKRCLESVDNLLSYDAGVDDDA